MMARRCLVAGLLLLLAATLLSPPARGSLPDQLTVDQFWALSRELSEEGGTFRSENLLSNERMLQHVIPSLTRAVPAGTAYVGVGPEQNFTYIAALRPSVAFIVDIRRGNLQLHLMYKALFELSADRADFVARLFSRAAPHVSPTAEIDDIFKAVLASDSNDTIFAQHGAAIRNHLMESRRLSLSEEDVQGIQWIHQSFYSSGPLIQYSSNFGRGGNFPTYMDLMTATDASGQRRSFLASPEAFEYVKALHTRNLIIPVVGDFAGDKALRAVGKYLRDRQAIVGAFYLSNVEQYLGREGRWHLFCENVASLPMDQTSSFIRSVRDGSYGRGLGLNSVLGGMLGETRACEP